jgi:beta-glucanase (GH16 family)
MKKIGALLSVFCVAVPFGASRLADAADTWHLVWSDEFNGASGAAPDPAKWGYDTGGSGWGNNEKEYYTNSTRNAYQDGSGHLVIKAIKESHDGMPYTSARLQSTNKGDWKYGKFEVRAKLPTGKGLWPAIWLLPTDYAYGAWPKSGEIDMMEQRGSDPLKVHGTIHFGVPWKYIGSSTVLSDAGYHTYAVEWDPDQIRWYVDGRLYQTRLASEWFSSGGGRPAPFDRRFHFLLNVAVGGNFDGDPDGRTTFPQTMMIDYVRVYDHGNHVRIPAQLEAEGYSAMHGVQMQDTTDAGGGQNVGWIDAGDWMDYPIEVPSSGRYTVQYRVASPKTSGRIELRAGATALATTSVPNTGGHQSWRTISATVELTAGRHTLRVQAAGGGFNLNWINFVSGSADPASSDPGRTAGPRPAGGAAGIAGVVSQAQFNAWFPKRNAFYTYAGLVSINDKYPDFADAGDMNVRKREVAALLANVSHETGDLVYVAEANTANYCAYCDPSKSYGCPAHRCSYYGRGPLQLSWNYNYKTAGDALGYNLLGNPGLVQSNANVSWQTAAWFWNTQTGAGSITPHNAMLQSNGSSGFGFTIKAINGALECPSRGGSNTGQRDARIKRYKLFCDQLGVSYGNNLSC